MGFVTITLLIVGMMISLMQFQKGSPAVKFVKLAELVGREFKVDNVGADVRMDPAPGNLRITYLTRVDSKFDTSVQNAEMRKVAEFAIKNYEGSDRHHLGEIQVVRSETHGSGCFQTTYVARFTLPNSYKGKGMPHGPGGPFVQPPPREK